MNMVIMHLSVPKEKEIIREDSNIEDVDIVYMLMKKKKNLIIKKVKMNYDSSERALSASDDKIVFVEIK